MVKRGAGTMCRIKKHTVFSVRSLEDDAVVQILLFEDSGDEVIPSDSGRSLKDNAVCSRIVMVVWFLYRAVQSEMQFYQKCIQDRQCTYKRNTEACSHNHCCHGKINKYYLFCVCACTLSYISCKAHAPYYIICGLSGPTHIFPRYLINGRIFGRKLQNIKCVFWVSHSKN
jgi:hypothetical protein